MHYKNKNLARVLAWAQFIFSGLIAASTILGYWTYNGRVEKVVESLASSIASVSKVVESTAETVQLNRVQIASTRQTLGLIRGHLKDVKAFELILSRQSPQYAESLQTASNNVVHLGDSLSAVGDGLMFLAPTSVHMDGLRPVIVMSRPLEMYAQKLKVAAGQIKGLGTQIPSIFTEGSTQLAAVGATTNQALKQLEETEKILERIEQNDLPNTLQEMKSTSENLRTISQQVGAFGNVGLFLLIFGLLLAGWCFLNSVSVLILIES